MEKITDTFIFNIPSHIDSEFGRLQKDILNELDFLFRERIISVEKWNGIRQAVLRNVNSVKRNMVLLIGDREK